MMSADLAPVGSVLETVHTSTDFWVNSPEFLIWLDRARTEVGPVPNDYGGEHTAQLAVQRALDAAVGVLGLVPPLPADPPPSSAVAVLKSSTTTPTPAAEVARSGRVAEEDSHGTKPTSTVGTAASTASLRTSSDPQGQGDPHASSRTSPSVSSPQIHNKAMSPLPHAQLGAAREELPTKPTLAASSTPVQLGTANAAQEAVQDVGAAVSPACVTCALGVCRRESHRGRPGWIDVTKLPRSLVTTPVENTRGQPSRSPLRVGAGSPRHTGESPTQEQERLHSKQRLREDADSSPLHSSRSRPSLSQRHRDGDESPNSMPTQVAPPLDRTEQSLHNTPLRVKRRARSPELGAAQDSARVSSKRLSLSPSAAPLSPAERAQPTVPHDAGDGDDEWMDLGSLPLPSPAPPVHSVAAEEIPWWYRNEGMRMCYHSQPCDREWRTGRSCDYAHTLMPRKPARGYMSDPGPCARCGVYGHWAHSRLCRNDIFRRSNSDATLESSSHARSENCLEPVAESMPSQARDSPHAVPAVAEVVPRPTLRAAELWWYRNENSEPCKFEKENMPCDREATKGVVCAFKHTLMPVEPAEGYLPEPGPCTHCGKTGHWSTVCSKDMPSGAGYSGWSTVIPEDLPVITARSVTPKVSVDAPRPIEERLAMPIESRLEKPARRSAESRLEPRVARTESPTQSTPPEEEADEILWWYRNDDMPKCKFERDGFPCDFEFRGKLQCSFRHSLMPLKPAHGYADEPTPCKFCHMRGHWSRSCPVFPNPHNSIENTQSSRRVSRAVPERIVRVEEVELPWYVRNEGAERCRYEQRHGQCTREDDVGKQCWFAHSLMPKVPRGGLLQDPGPCIICKRRGHSKMACPDLNRYVRRRESTRSPDERRSSGESRRFR